MIPACRRMPSYRRSGPARAPVWLRPARAPAADPPTYWARTGLTGVIRRAVLMKPPAVADPLDVKDDRFGLFVLAQVFEGVDDVDVSLVPATDRLAEADPPLLEVGERLRHVGAALGGKAEQARPFLQRSDGYVQGDRGVDDSHAVGAEHPHPGSRDDPLEPLLQFASFVAGLLEAGADNDCPLRPDRRKGFEQGDDLGRGDDKESEVRGLGKIARRGVRPVSQDGLFGGVDRIERALPAVLEDGKCLDGPHFHRVVARAGSGDGSRVQEQVQRIDRHAVRPPFSVDHR